MIPQPILQPDPDRNEFVLVADYRVYLEPVKKTLVVRKGYRQNGFSEPTIIAGFGLGFSRGDPRVLAVSQIHDPLYEAQLFNRSTCDELLCWAMKHNSRDTKAFSEKAHAALRLAGWTVWDLHTKESVFLARRFATIEEGNTQ